MPSISGAHHDFVVEEGVSQSQFHHLVGNSHGSPSPTNLNSHSLDQPLARELTPSLRLAWGSDSHKADYFFTLVIGKNYIASLVACDALKSLFLSRWRIVG